ncbi:bifunctional phosphoribosylaminoimidazolecarboxamide formyltransferase/IMP cyclohydrolase [Anaeromyxobacter sp. Fw109-5]|uniref:Bifunctional purine biosynthesis protein PurH n=1 Tax=Anaeromyxobacter sp. (strain Fw109-5) TaxID=404589 RepID=PUR9_ANADF|nr:bifunctional phosphoribosylaminoimidazolecarboxamide formyltransferase/IMP cyclohydrolase [Anaeromyxobacter sp. Fw109-5]A7HA60.1 RecName: Full=Bifunctional purine biosynthesis protein PurH; Includes: RecName: Full=Phosphoribosylaminoimidazolecarboxamide formyltransferase; AltName: Full=AICAR transformylase; Includes: RecName: Full=IMP cyclohydrolase; AltName: Full=ATIC; AltName: Full=IMP synthase; AltName: Full=Inosinicase [Anaeromyxobacter sp. Fw109-5]ABS25606.1 phosphoribosylaminoimidazoleca
MVRRALVSVSDKTGLVPFAKRLAALGVEILSTGGTQRALADAGVPVVSVGDYTQAPEILAGRVKTLHPRVHGGILYRRGLASDEADVKARDIPPIDLVVVNLYPFREAVAAGKPFWDCVEEIDIGGPTMVRSAAKNAAHVGVVVDPADYERVAAELEASRALSDQTRFELMKKAFAHTAAYDAAISEFLTARESTDAQAKRFPATLAAVYSKAGDLRYGENPHQAGAFYRAGREPDEPTVAFAKVLQGKELSYNNLLDLEAALAAVKEHDEVACVVIKHNTPCGVSLGKTPAEAFARARACDPVSAFGGIVALNRPVDAAAAKELTDLFLECVIAPGYDEAARAALGAKKNLRLLEAPRLAEPRTSWTRRPEELRELRSIPGGLLVMDRDLGAIRRDDCKVMTKRAPTDAEWEDLLFAWKVVKHVKSNAIVFAKEKRTVGIGGGQTSRVESVKTAVMKAQLELVGSTVGSDAFFPFKDGVEEIIKAGATAIIQPGGSVRDPEVIEAADAANVAMVATGMRHFRH